MAMRSLRKGKAVRLTLLISVITVAALILIISIASTMLVIDYDHRHQNDKLRLGVSFSIKYANELGLDWHNNYLGLLADMNVRHLRLMSYWDLLEPQPGQYNFDDLDWQLLQARKYHADVSLSIGMRQPRWPECHVPEWARNLPASDRNAKLNDFITRVVDRYKDRAEISSWQLENEALLVTFGECRDFDRFRLVKEYQLVKELDSDHPVIINVSDQHGIPINQPIGDKIGFSIYRRVYNTFLVPFYFDYFLPSLWFKVRAAMIESYLHRPVFVHELQAEPWGPKSTVSMTDAEQYYSMNPKQMVDNIDFVQRAGLSEMYLWGAEWWYWRKTIRHDDSTWQTATELFSKSQ
jgi:hypothetical protein